MSSPQQMPKVGLRVENIGGIDETTVSFEPGVTVLEGRNATNRTSLLRALMAVLGSDDATLKGDADEGSVKLTLDGETYTRRLHRTNGSVVFEGEPYLEDSTVADLFAFLLESNEARLAITTGDYLRELILRPVDTDAIQADIDDLVEKRTELQRELEELEDRKRELPKLEEERTRLRDEIESKRAELEAKEAEIESKNADVRTRREQQSKLQSKLSELRAVRSELKDIRFQIDAERESIEALETERGELEDERADLPGESEMDTRALKQELETLRERKQSIEAEINTGRNVIRFNESRFEAGDTDALQAALDDSAETGGAVTEQLLDDDTVVCWTCGTSVDVDQIEATLDQLRSLQEKRLSEREEIQSEIDELEKERKQIERARDQRNEIERRLTEIEDEIQERNDRISDLKEDREELSEDVKRLEAEVEDLEQHDDGELLELHEASNELEFEIKRREDDLETKNDRIAVIESELEREEEIEARRDEIKDEIADLRTRVNQIESEAVEQFNDHMDAILDALAFENLERIWIESIATADGSSRPEDRRFELNVVRSTESGTTYTDSVSHLSESERDVTGIVFALAGYLTHEVYDQLPFLLMDSLEAIDADRIDELLNYIAEYPEYLVVALLEEDAEAVTLERNRITDI